MRSKSILVLRCNDTNVRKGLESVLAPDNEGAPRGMRLTMTGRGRNLECGVEADSVASTLSTNLALLRDVALFQEVWLLSHETDARAAGSNQK